MMTAEERVAAIRERIEQALSPAALEIVDQSEAHAGHASAGAAGHYRIRVVAEAFAGHSLVQRHRMVFAALGELMQGEIHAAAIEAKTPAEAQ